MKRICQWVFFLFTSLCLLGCPLPVPMGPLRTGEPIKDKQVIMVEPGKTTKKELFEWFGAPMAIAARDEITVIPSVTGSLGGSLRRGHYKINSDTFFELFSADHELSEYHRVYYYRYAAAKKTGYFAVFAVYEIGKIMIDNLWVLVNEKTGVVEDYVFRKQD
jgi:hypothetical protein